MAKSKIMDLSIDGMHCASCALTLDKSLNRLDGVNEVNVDLNSNKAHMVINPRKITIDEIDKTVSGLGFNILKNEVKLKTQGMHCASCVILVEKSLERLDGIFNAHADLSSGIVTVVYDNNQISIDDMVKVIEECGFEYLSLEGELNETDMEVLYQNDLKEKRNRIIVGLSFSFLLMYLMFSHIHIPYLSLGQLSLIISIGPFIYVSYPIVKAGLTGLFHKNLNMDVMYTMGILVAYISSILGTFHIILDSSFMLFDTALMLPSFLMNISIGDILIVKEGDKVPVDGLVFDGKSYIDESMINGEPIPKLKIKDSKVYAGTINQEGIIKIKAQKIGKGTLLSQIIQMVEKAQSSKPPVQSFADKVVSVFIPIIITLALIVFGIWYFILSSSLLFALTTMISVLVVACPCALGLATPTAVTVGIGRAAEYGILIKNSVTLETAEKIKFAAFDKTGTITQGKPVVSDIIPLNSMVPDEILSYILSMEINSNHPLAKAIVKYGNENNINILDVDNFQNFTGKGLKGIINSHEVIVGNKTLLEDNNIEISKGFISKYENIIKSKIVIFLAIGNNLCGILTLTDKIKDNSKNTISKLQSMGITSYMLTGDNSTNAKNVADEVGIDNVYSNILPNEKLDKIEEIQTKYNGKVLFTGDGINDAPAITGADIGIALADGTDISVESGDIVLMDGNLENVVAALEISRKVMTRIKENIFWAFAYNIILIPLAAGAYYPLFGILFRPEFSALAMALSSVTVITLSLMLKSYIPPIKKEK